MEHRLERLEMKLMDLEMTVSELNEVLTRQYTLIDALQLENQKLNARLAALGEQLVADQRDETPPPHY